MSLPLSESYTLEDPSSSHIHAFIPPNLTGQINRIGNQYHAAGSFGDVYRCQYHSQCGVKEVAVKSFRFEFTVEGEDTNGRSNRMIRRELGIWKRLIHPNIVPFLGTVSGFGRFGNASLVSLWMPNGTLQDFLLKYDDKLTVAHRLQFLLGIANGLQYLHSLSIVHGDLTCNNVLLDEKHDARLTDFGYASLVGEIPEGLAYLQASTLRPGAVRWAAPEYFSSNPEEMLHCTTKSDIYSFGNIALQVLSGELPWSEFRRDAVVVLQLANGQKPRRPQSHSIDDQHWDLIEHCWSPVQERPSAEHLVFSILDFLRSYPHPQPFFSLLMSSEKSNLQSTLSGPLLSPPNTEQFSLNIPLEVPRTFENLHLMAPNRQYDQPLTIGGLPPPRIAQRPPQLIPDSNSLTLPLLPRKYRPHKGPEDDRGDEATSQVGHFQSTLETQNQNSPTVNPDVSVRDAVFPKRPPPAHSKSGAASPPFLNTSYIGQDQLEIYPFLYPSSQQHPIHRHHSQGTTASGSGDRGVASGSGGGRGGMWDFLFSRFGPHAPKTPTVGAPNAKRSSTQLSGPIAPQSNFDPTPADCIPPAYFSNSIEGSALDDSPPTLSLNKVLPQPLQQHQPPPPNVATLQSSFFQSFNVNPTSANNMSAYLTPGDPGAVNLRQVEFDSGCPGHNHLSRSEDMASSPSVSTFTSTGIHRSAPAGDIAFHSRPLSQSSSGPRGGGDGTWSALSSNRPSPYPSQTATIEHTAGASSRRRRHGANFLCPVPGCGSTFTSFFSLKGHMKSHDMDGPFQCKWPGCGKSFVREHDYKRHEQLHSARHTFTCEGCNKTFTRMGALNRHLRSEGGAECQRILDAARDSERPPITKTEEKGWPGMGGTA